jgi:roadblock/LC7 domain-containing protein|tara:strand:- start:7354 stop:7737 length:384 start_codon:yes stop_codon:yes gene_type:complete
MSILSSLIGPATSLLDKVIEDKDEKNRIAFELSTLAERHATELAKGQMEINKVEAAHKSLFVAGWRPSIGWCCSLGLLYHVLIAPIAGIWVEVPEIDPSLLMTTMTGMLGLGAMRSYEKTRGVSREK